MKFSDIKLDTNIKKAIEDLKFEKPTPIQKETIPFLLKENSDLIALAQTGTGKTAAFGVPIIQKVDFKKKHSQAIILCPTRELCLQITNDIHSYSKYIKELKTTAVYGGANIQTQIRALKSGTQIIVGTPGRVVDLIKRKCLNLKKINFVVLDEADEMLNMGFKDDLDKILNETPKEKQTLLFSATMPKEVMTISRQYMQNPKTIEVAKRNEGTKNVDHHYYIVNASNRYKALRRICDINPGIYGIIFCRTRRETSEIANKLMQDGYDADAIHGELSQAQRDHVMGRFRKRQLQILVATDVAARGIDINELTHVINYKLPDDNEIYVHRSGRTGRAGNKGVSIIIAHSREKKKLNSIQKMIKRELTFKHVPNGNEICQIQLMNLIDKVTNTEINSQIEEYIPSIEKKLSHLDKNQLIKHFVSAEFNRFLSFYKNAQDLNISESFSERKDRSRKDRSRKDRGKKNNLRVHHAEKGYTRFFINIGKGQGLQTHNLIGLINEYTKKRDIPIGKIDIMRNFSFFEIPSEFESIVIKGCRRASWNDNKITVEISQDPNKKRNEKVDSTRKREGKEKKKKRESQINKSKKRKVNNSQDSFKERFKKRTRKN